MTALRRWLVPVALAACCLGAAAGDRPYLATNSAAEEADDEGAWSVENWASRLGSVHAFTVAPEYAFDPTTSLQIELSHVRDGSAGTATVLAELEFKHLFNRIARDGYGWGVVVSPGSAKAGADSWKRDEWSARLPLSVSLWEGEGLLHLNVGFAKPRGTRREWTTSVALEREVWPRTTLFAEAAREGEATLLHAGARHWVRRERLAIDLSLQRVRGEGARASGVVFGIAWYDL